MPGAGDGVFVRLIGDKELVRQLDKLVRAGEGKDARKIIARACRAGSKVITKEARRRAPVGRKGWIKAAIKTRAIKRRPGVIGAQTQVGEGWFLGPEFYAAFVEFGHYAGKRTTGERRAQTAARRAGREFVTTTGRKWVKGRKYLAGAADSKQGQAVRVTLDELDRGILATVLGRA